MRKEIIVCDKCENELEKLGCKAKVSKFVFDIEITSIDLCVNCTKEFVTNWLKGEPIPKQTTT